MITRDQLLEYLRDALNNLADPKHLCQSPLVPLLGLTGRFDTFLALQETLTQAIESLEPAKDTPSSARAWRIYESLFYRYVQGLSQHEVANQLNMGVRQLQREQFAALEVLAGRLSQRFDLDGRPLQQATTAEPTSATPEYANAVNAELAWLKDLPHGCCPDPHETLQAALGLARPLAERYHVLLNVKLAAELPPLAVHPVAFSQMLLNMFSVAIPRARDGALTISSRQLQYQVELVVTSRQPARTAPLSLSDLSRLDMAARLASLSGGQLALSKEMSAGETKLILPILERTAVVALDDNPDALQLWQRYTTGTCYALTGMGNPNHVIEAAVAVSAQIVVLDVMMPQIDGWQVLGWLRQHPATGNLPIIVCTILDQQELALTLGATAFLKKPVQRQDFLAALDASLVTARESH